jgi:hypothetical protein
MVYQRHLISYSGNHVHFYATNRALMAVMTNATAIKRILGAKKTLDERDRKTGSRNSGTLVAVIGVLIITAMAVGKPGLYAQTKPIPAPKVVVDPQDTFPVPSGNPNQLFYLQRTNNTNTIVCELNVNGKGQLDEESPVHVFWIRYNEGVA